MDGEGLKLKHRHWKVRQIVLPHDQKVTASKVVVVTEEIGTAELCLSEKPLAAPLKDVVREGCPALDDPIAKTSGLLGEELTNTDLQLGNEAERGDCFTPNEPH